MNPKKLTVGALLAIVLVAFLFGAYNYQRRMQNSQMEKVAQDQARLMRFHSPTLGLTQAPVTIVEFFDPACETCRAFYSIVKDIMSQYPNEVRLVIRYAPFHQGSDQVVKLLEASRKQGKYWPVLESVLAAQPQWADHGNPNVQLAFQAAAQGGLNIEKALADIQSPDIDAILKQDIEDLTALEVTKTPTFFVNGRNLPSFGEQQLRALVAEEVSKTKK
ncbi:MAG: thioredoxin domain-containing protein [Hydrogenophaga sp.]|jgi:protein-disulfide isomerase|uniref:DsbA family protein n=1 Tax=Hydrogenophaga sp. TaxID=1904254 RepID=UPI001DF49FA6|nr:thioredoxin domain-containing protein [Hydrogenophaga sp.]MBW0171052.1 thioredoxin domain-containing protein [Hydrogenophaga sp.]MBW0183861.1 thioredoxin domain-containing protein [Hydrogenophaga sp.]